jgi:signal transduction histidine kinase
MSIPTQESGPLSDRDSESLEIVPASEAPLVVQGAVVHGALLDAEIRADEAADAARSRISAMSWPQRVWRQGVVQRRRSNGRNLLLRRLPAIVALGTFVLLAPISYSLADHWAKAEVDKRWAWMDKDLIKDNGDIVATLAGGPKPEHGWLVYPEENRVDRFEPGDIEPALFQMTKAAKDGPAWDNFQQQNVPFRSYARPINGKVWAINIIDIRWYDGEGKKVRGGAVRGALLASFAAALGLGLFARLLTKPTRRALSDRADFFADAAHEMRTPLAVIRASATHALSKGRATAEYVQSLAEISAAAERASAGVTELLDLARFDAGQALPRLAPLRLDLLAEEIAATTRVEECDVHAEVSPSALVQADLILLRQAVDNIVRNAASRSHEVALRCRVRGRDVELIITDDGPGFAPEQLPYVFERYRRGDTRGSLGLGLPIAASIVAAHGGSIEVVSPVIEDRIGSNRGASVIIRLPVARAQ